MTRNRRHSTVPARSGVPQFQPSELRNASCRRPLGRLRPDSVALTADLLAMAVAAGLTPSLALDLAARFGPRPVGDRLEAVRAEVEDRLLLADALDAEAGRNPTLAPLLARLAASERSGAPIGPALVQLAGSIRAQARRRAMARARTVPVRLLFPLVFLVLPAFLLLTVAPVVLASLSG